MTYLSWGYLVCPGGAFLTLEVPHHGIPFLTAHIASRPVHSSNMAVMLQVAPRDTVVTAHDVQMVRPSALGNGLQYKLPDRGLNTPEASCLEPAAAVQDPEVALNMESADVQAERDRVSAMTNFENECIVMRDLRKVYPSQVPLLFSCALHGALCETPAIVCSALTIFKACSDQSLVQPAAKGKSPGLDHIQPPFRVYCTPYIMASRSASPCHEVACIMSHFAGWQSCKASCEEPDNGCGEGGVLWPAGSQWRWQGHKQALQLMPLTLLSVYLHVFRPHALCCKP